MIRGDGVQPMYPRQSGGKVASRIFSYLDRSAVDDLLGEREGGVPTDIEAGGTSGRRAGVSVGANGGKFEAGADNARSESQRLKVNDSAKFNRLFDQLQVEDEIVRLTAFDRAIFEGLTLGTMVEIHADLQVPEMVRNLHSIGGASAILRLAAAAADQDDPSNVAAMNLVEGLFGKMDAQPIPMLVNATGSPRYPMAARLLASELRVSVAELPDQALVMGKIIKIIPRGKSYTLWSPIPGMELSGGNRHERRAKAAAGEDTSDPTVSIRGYAVILYPLAIYV